MGSKGFSFKRRCLELKDHALRFLSGMWMWTGIKEKEKTLYGFFPFTGRYFEHKFMSFPKTKICSLDFFCSRERGLMKRCFVSKVAREEAQAKPMKALIRQTKHK